MKTQNQDIQFFKFVYSCVIVIYHLAASSGITCPGGYCAVEFFLLSAGLFLFLSFARGEEKGTVMTPVQYAAKRFGRFFPWALTAFLLTVFVQRILIGKVFSPVAWMDYFSKDIWELLLISANGMNDNTYFVNSPAWTLSAMLIAGFFIWTLLFYYKKQFWSLVLPLTLVFGYGYWMHLPSANTELWIGFTTFGLFRTWIVMCLSGLCVPFARKLSGISFNKKGRILLTSLEVLIHVFALAVMFSRAQRHYQWLLTALFVICLAIALSGHSYLAKASEKSRLVSMLGNLSMSVYLVHTAVIMAFGYVFDMSNWSYLQLLPVFAAVLLVAVLHQYVTKWCITISRRMFEKIKIYVTQ